MMMRVRPALAVAAAVGVGLSGAAAAAQPAPQQRLTVGGALLSTDGDSLRLSGELVCFDSTGRSNLVVHTDSGVFHLEQLTEVTCTGDGAGDGGSLNASGTGTLDGQPTEISLRLTDGGAGRPDTGQVTVGRAAGGGILAPAASAWAST
jgi:hypothetical protein